MASDEEDEELAALRFAALASMKSKQKPLVEEDEDLKALKEAALRTLEQTLVIPSLSQNVSTQSSIPTQGHLHPVQHVQHHSPNFYPPHAPMPPSQYGQSQYSQPPPNYQPVHNIQSMLYPVHNHHQAHQGRTNVDPSTTGGVTRATSSVAGISRSNTPPVTARGNGGKSGGPRGNIPRGLPPRANNLIVISPMPMGGEEQEASSQTKNSLPKVETSSKPVLLRPQDKWCSGTSDSNSLTASPSRPKASGKFSRFDTSSSDSEESESEDEVIPVNKSSDRASDSDGEKSGSNAEKKLSAGSESEASSDCQSVQSKSNKSANSSSDDSDNDSDKDSDVDSDQSSDDSNKEESSDEEKSDSDGNSEKAAIVHTKQESETEEEKLERREADRLLEETMDRRQVQNSISEREDREMSKWTSEKLSVTVPLGESPRAAFDLSHKLMHHRARVKEQNGSNSVPGDLSSKLTNRRKRQEVDQNNSAPVDVKQAEFVNIKIQKTVDISEPHKPKLSQEDLQKMEARKRKFESSPVSAAKEGKKTISLKGIVPRSKKRQKERHRSRSASPVPKRYSRDLERYEKKKASKVRHKSGSKENKEQKTSAKSEPRAKDITDSLPLFKKRTERKSLENKKNISDNDSSDDSKLDVCAQMSDSESDEEGGRSWRKESNKSRLVFNRDRGISVRDRLDPVRFDDRQKQDYRSSSSRPARFGDRRRRFDEPRVDVILPKHRRGGGRHRSVEVLHESESDSDGPKLHSSVVLPINKQHSDRQKDKISRQNEGNSDLENEDSNSSRDSAQPVSLSARKRMVVSSELGRKKQSKGSRKVTTDLDARNTLSFRTKSKSEHSKRKTDFESRDRSPFMSVTLDSDKDLSETEPSRSRSSVHERLGRQLNSPDSNADRAKTKRKDRDSKKKKSDDGEEISVHKGQDESSKADDDLEQRIQRIKEKNAAILKRQEEVRQDKERYG